MVLFCFVVLCLFSPHVVTEVIIHFIHKRAGRSLKSHTTHICDVSGSYSNFQFTLQGEFNLNSLFIPNQHEESKLHSFFLN